MKWTDGPWYYVSGAAWTTPNGPDDGGQCVLMRASDSQILPVTRDANLRLGSTSPELYDALDCLVEAGACVVDRWERGNLADAVHELEMYVNEARDVLAKARGVKPR